MRRRARYRPFVTVNNWPTAVSDGDEAQRRQSAAVRTLDLLGLSAVDASFNARHSFGIDRNLDSVGAAHIPA